MTSDVLSYSQKNLDPCNGHEQSKSPKHLPVPAISAVIKLIPFSPFTGYTYNAVTFGMMRSHYSVGSFPFGRIDRLEYRNVFKQGFTIV